MKNKDDDEYFKCECGEVFSDELGIYGCPACCGDSGAATRVCSTGLDNGVLFKAISGRAKII